MDHIDLQILNCLKKNARIQWKDIGKQVHLTGQAVAFRVRQMEDEGIIQGYTAVCNAETLGNITAYITVIMKSANHQALHEFVQITDEIEECHRISGDGCYLLKVVMPNQDAVSHLLDQILQYGNYRLNLSISAVKTAVARERSY